LIPKHVAAEIDCAYDFAARVIDAANHGRWIGQRPGWTRRDGVLVSRRDLLEAKIGGKIPAHILHLRIVEPA
jgi:hypothetical protein